MIQITVTITSPLDLWPKFNKEKKCIFFFLCLYSHTHYTYQIYKDYKLNKEEKEIALLTKGQILPSPCRR